MPDDTSSRKTAYGERSPFRAARKEPLLMRTIPVAGQLPGYRVGAVTHADSTGLDAVEQLTKDLHRDACVPPTRSG